MACQVVAHLMESDQPLQVLFKQELQIYIDSITSQPVFLAGHQEKRFEFFDKWIIFLKRGSYL